MFLNKQNTRTESGVLFREEEREERKERNSVYDRWFLGADLKY